MNMICYVPITYLIQAMVFAYQFNLKLLECWLTVAFYDLEM